MKKYAIYAVVFVVLGFLLVFSCTFSCTFSSGVEDCTFSPVPGIEIPCAEPDVGQEDIQ